MVSVMQVKIREKVERGVGLPWPLLERQAIVMWPPIHSFADTLTQQTCLQWSATVCSCLDSVEVS